MFFLYLLTALSMPASAGSQRIATWNIYWLTDTEENTRSPADYRYLQQVVTLMAADVIAFQEVQNQERAAHVFDQNKFVFEVSRNLRGDLHTGFAIRNGTVYRRLEDITVLNGTGYHRNGVVIELSTPRGPLTLINIHLASGCFEGELQEPGTQACRLLADQFLHLDELWERLSSKSRPTLLLGDFNRRMTQRNDAAWAQLSHGPAAGTKNYTMHRSPLCWGGHFRDYIDHIVANPAATPFIKPHSFGEVTFGNLSFETAATRLSDHCPLFIDLVDDQRNVKNE